MGSQCLDLCVGPYPDLTLPWTNVCEQATNVPTANTLPPFVARPGLLQHFPPLRRSRCVHPSWGGEDVKRPNGAKRPPARAPRPCASLLSSWVALDLYCMRRAPQGPCYLAHLCKHFGPGCRSVSRARQAVSGGFEVGVFHIFA